jgi:hypothetical protein
MKHLDLYSISFETFQAKCIKEASYTLAGDVARRNYQNVVVGSIFSGTTLLSMEMAHHMTHENSAFVYAHNFIGSIAGLGDAVQFQRFFNNHVLILIEMSRQNPCDTFEIMLQYGNYHFGFGIGTLRQNCLDAVNYMFSLISDDRLGIGVFHDPFVALAAHFLGFEGARSLRDMEAISFVMGDDGKIRVLGIKEVVS